MARLIRDAKTKTIAVAYADVYYKCLSENGFTWYSKTSFVHDHSTAMCVIDWVLGHLFSFTHPPNHLEPCLRSWAKAETGARAPGDSKGMDLVQLQHWFPQCWTTKTGNPTHV